MARRARALGAVHRPVLIRASLKVTDPCADRDPENKLPRIVSTLLHARLNAGLVNQQVVRWSPVQGVYAPSPHWPVRPVRTSAWRNGFTLCCVGCS